MQIIISAFLEKISSGKVVSFTVMKTTELLFLDIPDFVMGQRVRTPALAAPLGLSLASITAQA